MTSKAKLLLRKIGGAFTPGDPYAVEQMEKMPPGLYAAEVGEQRSVPQNNVYWAGMAWGIANIEALGMKYPDTRAMHEAMLIHLGYFTEVPFVQLRREPVTAKMMRAGEQAAAKLGLELDGATLAAIYEAMHRAGPHYGVNLMPNSTRFERMKGEDFKLYFDRAKVAVWQWVERDPWAEWYEERKGKPRRRR